MSERGSAVAAVLIASMFVGCSYGRNIGEAAQTRTPQPRSAGAIDYFVPHISTERSNKGSRVSLFVRERRGAAPGPVVLFVQGRSAAAVPSFDLAYADYSWMVYLADAGFDVFAMDLQGYGSSSRPTVMNDPCNTSADNQAKFATGRGVPLRTLDRRHAEKLHLLAGIEGGNEGLVDLKGASWNQLARWLRSLDELRA